MPTLWRQPFCTQVCPSLQATTPLCYSRPMPLTSVMTTSHHSAWIPALILVQSRDTALGRFVCLFAGAGRRALEGQGPTLLHHEAPILSSDWTGGRCRGAGRSAAGRLALQIQWSPKYSPFAPPPLAYSLHSRFLLHAYILFLLSTACMRDLPACQHLASQLTLTVQRHSMFPCKPPGVPTDLWALELPSILGAAHSDFPSSPEPSSPSASEPGQETGTDSPALQQPADASVGSLSAAHQYAPDSDSLAPPLASADVLSLDISDTEDPHSPVIQVSASSTADSYTYDWNVPSAALRLVLDLQDVPPHLWQSPAPPSALAAESKAYALLHQGFATFEDIAELLDYLPGCQHAKRRRQHCDVGLPRQCSFSAGAFTFSHSTGIQLSTMKYPLVVQLLTSIVRGACPGIQFSSITLQRNVLVRMHTDKHNEHGRRASLHHAAVGRAVVSGSNMTMGPMLWTSAPARAPCSESPGPTYAFRLISGMPRLPGHPAIALS